MNYKILVLLSVVLLISPSIFGMHLTSEDSYFDNDEPDFSPPLPGCLHSDGLSPFQKFVEQEQLTSFVSKSVVDTQNFDISRVIQDLSKNIVLSFIENLTSFGPRVTGSEACENAGQWIYQTFSDMGLQVRYQNWSVSSSIFGSNIEATLPGIDESSNDEIYLVCAHYDSVYGSPGADDNAAGTAAVIAVADVMSDYTFNHTVKFVTFSGEEQGLHGSFYYAKQAYENNESIIAVLNADMMGYAPTKDFEEKVIVFYSESSTWITEFTTNVSIDYADLINLEVVPGGYSGRSDHASFYIFDYEGIFYFEYKMNPHYHSTHDTIENMNPWYATNVSKLILATLSEMSGFIPQLPPKIPQRPTGKINGKSGTEYVYETKTIDPNNDDIYYKWLWGNNSTSDWIGPFDSDELCSVSNVWSEEGDYVVQVKARDYYFAESDWSKPLPVTMPYSQRDGLINWFFEKIPFFRYFWDLFSI